MSKFAREPLIQMTCSWPCVFIRFYLYSWLAEDHSLWSTYVSGYQQWFLGLHHRFCCLQYGMHEKPGEISCMNWQHHGFWKYNQQPIELAIIHYKEATVKVRGRSYLPIQHICIWIWETALTIHSIQFKPSFPKLATEFCFKNRIYSLSTRIYAHCGFLLVVVIIFVATVGHT